MADALPASCWHCSRITKGCPKWLTCSGSWTYSSRVLASELQGSHQTGSAQQVCAAALVQLQLRCFMEQCKAELYRVMLLGIFQQGADRKPARQPPGRLLQLGVGTLQLTCPPELPMVQLLSTHAARSHATQAAPVA